ncbi:MAG: carbohydrate kinase family protein [Candidatus Magasanikbacteria bacterium]
MYKIIAIGDVILDTHIKIDDASVECDLDGRRCKLCLDYATKIPVTDSFQTIGGNSANLAFSTTKLGLSTAILSTVGYDSNGQIIVDALKKSKINTEFIFSDKKAKTRYSTILNFQGERTILSYHQKRNYIWPKDFPATDWIYYTSLSEGFDLLQTKLLKFLEKHSSVRLAFNPGSFQLKNDLELTKTIIAKSDLLIVNLEEAEKLAGANLNKSKSVQSIIHKLLELGAHEVVITDGANGAWAGNVDSVWYSESYPVKIVSKTGAGDAFSAGYLSAKLYGHDLPTCLTWGIANSCSVLGHFGVQDGLLDRNGLKKMIEKYSKIKPQEK